MERLLSEHGSSKEVIERTFGQASGKWTGCDWPTRFGKHGLDLNGLKASQALLLARATSGSEKADWLAAVEWLSRIEMDRLEADLEADQALVLALAGKVREALPHVHRVCAIESRYHNRLIWQPFQEAIEAALEHLSVE